MAQTAAYASASPPTDPIDEALPPLSARRKRALGNALMFDPANAGRQRAGPAAAHAQPVDPAKPRRQPHRPAGRLQHHGGETAAAGRLGRQVGADLGFAATAPGQLPAAPAAPGSRRRAQYRRRLGLGRRAAQSRHARRAVDPSNDQGRLGTTVKHACRSAANFVVTLQNSVFGHRDIGTPSAGAGRFAADDRAARRRRRRAAAGLGQRAGGQIRHPADRHHASAPASPRPATTRSPTTSSAPSRSCTARCM